jgi:hypothetical protein
VDGEAWSLNRGSFAAFLDTLVESGHPRFVFLSGDVHYGFTAVGRYDGYFDRGTRSIELVQFCSSATKNASGGAGQAAIPALQSDRVQRISFGTGELRWRLYRPVTSNNVGVVTVGPGWVEQRLLVPRMRAADRARSPYTQRITWNDFPIS